MVSFRVAFPDAVSSGGVLNDVAQQMAMAGQAFLLSTGLMTAEMQEQIGPTVDTAEDYNLIAETIRENEDIVFEQANRLSADASASNIMMMQAAFGIMDPDSYGPYIDDYLTDSGFADMDSDTLAEVVSLLSRFTDGTAGPAPEERDVPSPDQQDYAEYFISTVVLEDKAPYVREVWDASRAEGVSVEQAIEDYLENYAEDYQQRFEEANGREMSTRELNAFNNEAIADLRNRLAAELNSISQLHYNLSEVPNIDVSPNDIAHGFALGVILEGSSQYSRRVYEEMLTSDVDFETAYGSVMDEVMRSHSGPGPTIDDMRERIREEIEAAERSVGQVETYESVTVTSEDAMRFMANSWAERDNLPNTPEHYLEFMEERIEYYQSAEGGNLDEQTASIRAAVDSRNQVDLDSGVPEAAVNDPYLYPHDLSLFEDSIRREIIEQEGLDISAVPHTYHVYRDTALEVATELEYNRAYAEWEANGFADPDAEEPEPEATEPDPEADPAPDDPAPEDEEPDYPFTDQDAFDANNPFRMFATAEDAAAPDFIQTTADTVHAAIEHSAELGTISLEEAIIAMNQVRVEEGIEDIDGARLASIQEELGIEAGERLSVNDPQLMEALAAYVNDMPVAELPQDWKNAFAVETLPQGAAIPPVGDSFAEAVAAASAAGPELSMQSPAFEDGVHQIQATITQSYDNFMAELPENMSPELIELNNSVVALQGDIDAAFDEQNFEAFLESTYELSSLLAESTDDAGQAAAYAEQADSIQEFADRVGIDVTEPDAEEYAAPAVQTETPSLPRDPVVPEFGQ